MSFNTLRFRQTPFRDGDKLVFKSSGSLPLFDIHVNAGDYFLRSTVADKAHTKVTKEGLIYPLFGSWRLYNERKEAISQTNPSVTYTDIQIRQMLGHKGFGSNFEDTVILSDSEGEELLKKFESGEKAW